MDKNKNPMDQIITEDLLSLADEIDKEIDAANMPKMPADVKARIKAKLDQQIAEYEKARLIEKLSDDDKKALELGRKMLENEDAKEEHDGKTAEVIVYRKKPRRTLVAVAAIAILVLAMGMTCMGGPKRVIEKMGVWIFGREVVRVDTEEDNYVVTSEDEEAAYQEIKEVFGVDAIRLTHWPEGTAFLSAEIDEKLQVATVMYEYDGQIVSYYISTHFTDSSWGLDVEDRIINTYQMDSTIGKIEVKEYETIESKTKRYSVAFSENGMEYFLIGTMKQKEFNYLVENIKNF